MVALDDIVINELRVEVDIETHASVSLYEATTRALLELGSEAESGHIETTITVGSKDELGISHGRRDGSEERPARHYRWELFFAAKHGDVDRLRELEAQGVSLTQVYAEYHGWSLLHLAARAGSAEAVTLVLDAGVDPDIASATGTTPLSLTPSREVARLLLAAGADVDRPVGRSVALAIAFQREHDEVGELLLEHGAKLPESARMEIVEVCTRRGRIGALRRLATLGSEVTALFVEPEVVAAAIASGPVVLDFLLNYGAKLPDSSLEQAAAELEELDGAQQRRLLARLAKHMVSSGIFVVTEAQLCQLVAVELDGARPQQVLRALVERDGILREAAGGGYEFLDDSLKTRFAAEAFIDEDAPELLASHAHQDAWRRVILSAAAEYQRARGFTTRLIRALLEQLADAPGSGMNKARMELTRFVHRCCIVASASEEPEILAACWTLSEDETCPANVSRAVALEACGEAVAPFLEKRGHWTARQRAASIQALGRIGGERARRHLQSYADESVMTTIVELLRLPAGLAPRLTSDQITSIDLLQKNIGSLDPLAGLPNLTSLYLSRTTLAEVSSLGRLSQLTTLDWHGESVDLSVVASLSKLTTLDVTGPKVTDLSALASLSKLTDLYARESLVSDLSPLASLSELTTLSLPSRRVRDVSPLAGLSKLTSLWLHGAQVADVSPLATCTALTELVLWNALVTDVTPLAGLVELTRLDLDFTRVSDVAPLAMLPGLTRLSLQGTQVSDVSPLAGLDKLTYLDLRNTKAVDLAGLESRPNIEIVRDTVRR